MASPASAGEPVVEYAPVHFERQMFAASLPTRWQGIIGSLFTHAVVLAAVLLPAIGYRTARPLPLEKIAEIFAPAPPVEAAAPAPASAPALAVQAEPKIESLATPTPVLEAPVNLSRVQLSFADDLREELPGVVRAQQGMLGLLDKEDLSITRYVLRPPDWDARPMIGDVSRKLVIYMENPQRWAVFRQAAQRIGAPLDQFQACAVFDISYSRCLQDAIRRRSGGAPVSWARLAVAPGSPCGIEAVEVSHGAISNVHP
jgi:hypothetical protein